jgi:hypothetical protein
MTNALPKMKEYVTNRKKIEIVEDESILASQFPDLTISIPV